MSQLSKEQTESVASWFAAGASLDEIQKRLRSEFDVHMTYLDLRLLVADLPQPVEKEPEPKKTAAPAPASAEPAYDPQGMDELPPGYSEEAGMSDYGSEQTAAPVGPTMAAAAAKNRPTRYDLDAPDADQGIPKPDVEVEIDAITIPGTYASGDVTFSDGTKGKWYLDHSGRLGLGNCPQGYQPSAADAQLFQQRLVGLLRQRGLA